MQIRREKNRQAQRIFKARREAAQAESEKRIAQLEHTLESMCELFLNMADKLMTSATMREETDLAQQLQESMGQCLSLMRASIDHGDGGGQSENSPKDSTMIRQTGKLSLLQVDQITSAPDAIDSLFNNDNDAENMPTATLGAYSNPIELLTPATYVSNTLDTGRTDGPLNLYHLPRPIHLESRFEQDFVGAELVRCTLNHAYQFLRDAGDVSTGLAAIIFGPSLQTYSKEQIMSKLLWSLGRSSVLEGYAGADPKAMVKVTTADFSAIDESSPGLGTLAIDNEESLINADDVVKWLVSIGVRKVDEGILEVPTGNQAELDRVSAPEYSQGRYSFLKADLFFSPEMASDNSEASKGPGRDSFWISQAALFGYLSHVAVCLTSGIAYHRHHLAKIIRASQVR